MHVVGNDSEHQLGINPTTKSKYDCDCVDDFTKVPFDVEGIQCISSGSRHSVIIKEGCVYAAGDDRYFNIGSDSRQIYETFTKINISPYPIKWAACDWNSTLYLTNDGDVIKCHQGAIGEKIIVQLDGFPAIHIFEDTIIDETGSIFIFEEVDPHKPPTKYTFDMPAVDVVTNESCYLVLTADGRVFEQPYNSNEFSEVASLKGKKIKKLSGKSTCSSIASLSSDGRVFIKSNQTFSEVRLNEPIKDVGISNHTLFLTKSNKIYGCGMSDNYQLTRKANEEEVIYPVFLASIKADHVIAGEFCSFILLPGKGKIKNPAKDHFKYVGVGETSSNRVNRCENEDLFLITEEQGKKIDDVLKICQAQSQSIAKLSEMCLDLQKQNEARKKEMHDVKKYLHKLGQKIQEMKDELGGVSPKIDAVVKYINDQDIY